MCDLKQDTSFSQGVGAVQQALAQDTDLPGEEAVEVPYSVDSCFEFVFRQALPPIYLPLSTIYLL